MNPSVTEIRYCCARASGAFLWSCVPTTSARVSIGSFRRNALQLATVYVASQFIACWADCYVLATILLQSGALLEVLRTHRLWFSICLVQPSTHSKCDYLIHSHGTPPPHHSPCNCSLSQIPPVCVPPSSACPSPLCVPLTLSPVSYLTVFVSQSSTQRSLATHAPPLEWKI